jgi:hypothetical protein
MKKRIFKIYNPDTFDNNSIDEFELVKSTEKSVWLLLDNGNIQRNLKITAAYMWFDSKEEAYKYMEDRMHQEIYYAQRSLTFYSKKLKDFYKEHVDIQRDKKLKELLL